MKTTTIRQQKSLDTKKRIYQVFCRLSACYDGNFTVKELCEEAGVSVGSFYHYFGSKEGVTHYLYDYLGDEICACAYPEAPDARILAICRRFMEISMEKGVAFMKMATVYETSHRPTIATGHYEGQIFHSNTSRLLCDALSDGAKAGIFHLTKPIWHYADLIIFLCRSQLHFWMVSDGEYELLTASQRHISTFVELLKTGNTQ